MLVAIRDGAGHALWPLMRRAFLRRRWIIATSDPRPPAMTDRAPRTPPRQYRVTDDGLMAIAAYEAMHGIDAGVTQVGAP
jgi:hypothetical protein